MHAEEAWYVGPAMSHYRCYTVIMKKTGYIRITDTVQFRHHINPPPTVTTTDRVVEATNNLVSILNKAATEVPLTQPEAIEVLRKVLRDPNTAPAEKATQQVNIEPIHECFNDIDKIEIEEEVQDMETSNNNSTNQESNTIVETTLEEKEMT